METWAKTAYHTSQCALSGFLRFCGRSCPRKLLYLLFRLPHAGEFGRKSLQSPCAVLAHCVRVMLVTRTKMGKKKGTKRCVGYKYDRHTQQAAPNESAVTITRTGLRRTS